MPGNLSESSRFRENGGGHKVCCIMTGDARKPARCGPGEMSYLITPNAYLSLDLSYQSSGFDHRAPVERGGSGENRFPQFKTL